MAFDEIKRRELTRNAVALILAGGRGSRLYELTDKRVKPAVQFGGKFRIVDFPLSNCVNAGLRRIGILTQYKSHSLLRHLQRGWSFLRPELNEFIDLLPAQQRRGEEWWYRGTADAVYQNTDILESHAPEHIVVLAGDHIYKMDYSILLAMHADSGAPCTAGAIEVPRMEATAFGVMAVDESDRVTAFVEKPADPPAIPGQPDQALASMGIYVFDAAFMYEELARDGADATSSHDFGKDIMPSLVARGLVAAHRFSHSCVVAGPEDEAYWRDVGTIDAYWQANVDLTGVEPPLDMYDTTWPIRTHQPQLPPTKFVFDTDERRGAALDSLISGGCIISGSTVRRSLLFSQVRVNSYCTVEGAVLLPEVTIERKARLTNVIVDRGCVIPEGLVVGEDAAADEQRFRRTPGGVTLITQPMLDAL